MGILVQTSILPSSSLLNNDDWNYCDSFETTMADANNIISTKDIGKAFFNSAPKWTEHLFIVRNKIVSILGLKTSGNVKNRQHLLDNFKCEPGERLGLFKIFEVTETELIMGENDRHLDFRVSLHHNFNPQSGHKTIHISTTVKFHNWFGKLYFLPVKPFHTLIVPAMLKGIVKQLEKDCK
ncbi:MAG: DUF2867 domain-containing protein [Pyrinomonadaceae bacterium]|nr:DUF2867 domain-containing protein [Sphingobacteriaceae bacterium]